MHPRPVGGITKYRIPKKVNVAVTEAEAPRSSDPTPPVGCSGPEGGASSPDRPAAAPPFGGRPGKPRRRPRSDRRSLRPSATWTWTDRADGATALSQRPASFGAASFGVAGFGATNPSYGGTPLVDSRCSVLAWRGQPAIGGPGYRPPTHDARTATAGQPPLDTALGARSSLGDAGAPLRPTSLVAPASNPSPAFSMPVVGGPGLSTQRPDLAHRINASIRASRESQSSDGAVGACNVHAKSRALH